MFIAESLDICDPVLAYDRIMEEIGIEKNLYGRQEEIYECEDCSGCPYAERCKKAERNRTVSLNRELTAIHREVLENLENIHGALLRMNRSIQAEGTFGILKQDRLYNRIVRRGMSSTDTPDGLAGWQQVGDAPEMLP